MQVSNKKETPGREKKQVFNPSFRHFLDIFKNNTKRWWNALPAHVLIKRPYTHQTVLVF